MDKSQFGGVAQENGSCSCSCNCSVLRRGDYGVGVVSSGVGLGPLVLVKFLWQGKYVNTFGNMGYLWWMYCAMVGWWMYCAISFQNDSGSVVAAIEKGEVVQF